MLRGGLLPQGVTVHEGVLLAQEQRVHCYTYDAQ